MGWGLVARDDLVEPRLQLLRWNTILEHAFHSGPVQSAKGVATALREAARVAGHLVLCQGVVLKDQA
jgi:hypothetical protein